MKSEKYIRERTNKNGKAYTISYKGITKTFAESDYGSSCYRQAINFRNELLAKKYIAIAKGRTIEICFDEVADFFSLRNETKRKYYLYFNKYLSAYKDIDITKLKKADIIECLNKMVDVASDDTIQRVFTIWKRLVFMCCAKEYISIDITFGIMPPKSHKICQPKEINVVDEQLFNKIIDLTSTKLTLIYDRKMIPLILKTLYLTGMRPCECVVLNKDDVNDVISINKELASDRDNPFTIRNCKTATSVRKIPITNELSEIIDSAKKLSKSNILFANIDGRYYTTKVLTDKINHLCKVNDIKFNLYALRHNFSTRLINNGINPRTHQELMGRKNYTMSVNYARSTNDQKLDALNVFAKNR